MSSVILTPDALQEMVDQAAEKAITKYVEKLDEKLDNKLDGKLQPLTDQIREFTTLKAKQKKIEDNQCILADVETESAEALEVGSRRSRKKATLASDHQRRSSRRRQGLPPELDQGLPYSQASKSLSQPSSPPPPVVVPLPSAPPICQPTGMGFNVVADEILSEFPSLGAEVAKISVSVPAQTKRKRLSSDEGSRTSKKGKGDVIVQPSDFGFAGFPFDFDPDLFFFN